ncbi:PST family polysaccharide transporter [Arcticibacter pallidicorallinus]|uniref:PST family polysaccharide transporter n=1 Tax=Arcticibacter pallidicorallinus TaxID=1259464 RepID=A0A2T0U9H5_9SPHI|nr:flippase [Arcticibacter pallidicorallinus]PRY54583.1 PST family polysaccharide transporter [Arcticibacter pallidicorallinus]
MDTNKQLSSGKKLVRNFFSLSLVQFANNVLPLLTVPVIVRIIGPDKFGAINFAAAIVTYFSLLINYGFDLTATRAIARAPHDKEERNRVFSNILFAKILLLSLSLLVFVPSLFLVPAMAADKDLFIFTYIACFSLVITPNWLYQGLQELHQVAIFNFIAKLLFTISILFIVRKEEDYALQPLILSLSQIAVGLCSFVWAVRKYNITIIPVGVKNIFTLLWTEKMIFFSMIVVTLYTTTNTIILGVVQTNKDVAFYTAGWKLIMIMQTFVSLPLRLSLFPFIGESFGRSKADGIAKVSQLIPFITIFTAVSGAVIWVLAPWMIQMFYGSQFGEAVTVLRILCFVPLILALGDLFGIQTMINLKMDKQFFNITLLGAGVGLILNYFLSKQSGAAGTAWAWLLTEVFITSSMWIFLCSRKIQLLKISYFRLSHLSQLVRPFVFTLKKKVYKNI